MTGPINRSFVIAGAAAALAAAAAPCTAQLYQFTFEEAGPGHHPTLSSSFQGMTMTVSRPGDTFEIIQRPDLPHMWQQKALWSIGPGGATTTPIILDFSHALEGVWINTGDFGGDADTITASAYDAPGATGNHIHTVSTVWNGNLSTSAPAPTPPARLILATPPGVRIRSVVLSAVGGGGTHTVAYDFITAVVPKWGCGADLTGTAVPGQPGYGVPNGIVDNDDFFYFLGQFSAGNVAVCDWTTTATFGQPGYGIPNGVLDNEDFFYFLAVFASC